VTATEDVLMSELGIEVVIESEVARGRALITPLLCAPGTQVVRAGMLANWTDMLAGSLAATTVAPKLVVTADLTVRLIGDGSHTNAIVASAHALKRGQATIVLETRFWADDADEDLVAVAHAMFVTSPRPADAAVVDLCDLDRPSSVPLSSPVAERAGLRHVSPGVVELEHRPDVLNISGAMQGGLVALLAEEAALSASPDATWATSLEVRFLRAFREGPARAVATRLSQDLYQVEVMDIVLDRLGAVAIVETSDA
jgi:acyl-coenzyme A thioesterase PaaI-like protein